LDRVRIQCHDVNTSCSRRDKSELIFRRYILCPDSDAASDTVAHSDTDSRRHTDADTDPNSITDTYADTGVQPFAE
jgi:hypothetical protein